VDGIHLGHFELGGQHESETLLARCFSLNDGRSSRTDEEPAPPLPFSETDHSPLRPVRDRDAPAKR
jgi:hypothetical protein